MRPAIFIITVVYAAILVFIALIRADLLPENITALFDEYERFLYIGAVILTGLLLMRAGAPMARWGFETGLKFRYLALALIGVAVIEGFQWFGLPLLEGVVEPGAGSGETDALEGNLQLLLTYLLLSWTFAAFGEEIAFRVVLMRGLQASFGGGTGAALIALFGQALIFGFVHYYNGGQLAVIRTGFNALVYGALVLSARGVIWPAVIAHGLHNTINLTMGYLPETD